MNLEIGDKVNLRIERETDLGFVVIINDEVEGLLYSNEVFQILKKDDEIKGYIKKLRDDGKIDVSIKPQGFVYSIDDDCDIITSELKLKGIIKLSDKSSPEEIKIKLNMSKKAFKKAIGFLYKRKIIIIGNDQIELKKIN